MSNPVIDQWGDKRWYDSQGLLHRLDGPAVEYSDDVKKAYEYKGYKGWRWWINGQVYSKKEYFKQVIKYISKEDFFVLRLKYE